MRTVHVTSTDEGLRQSITIGPHTLIADEPVDIGGTDEGPAPHDFLLAGLGACTAITLKLYAKRKGWDLQHVDVSLEQSREGEVFNIRRTVTLKGNLDADQRKRLLDIANRCPVHRTLIGEIKIDTALTEG